MSLIEVKWTIPQVGQNCRFRVNACFELNNCFKKMFTALF